MTNFDFSQYGTLADKSALKLRQSTINIGLVRFKFIEKIRRQAVMCGDGKCESGAWFSNAEDGSVIVSIRKGTTKLDLGGGKKYLIVPDMDAARKFYFAVIESVERGEFDEILTTPAAARSKKEQA